MLLIESAQNDTFKKILSLTFSRGLKKEGLFLLGGKKLIDEFLRKPNLKIVYELTAPGMHAHAFPLKNSPDAKEIQFSSELFAQIDVLGTHFNILVLEQPAMVELKEEELTSYKPQGIEVVMPIGDPGNLGALIRSCEAFGVKRVILAQEAAHPFLPKAVKASAGSVLRLPLSHGPVLGAFPDSAIALDMEGTSIDDYAWPKDGLLIVGEEGLGFDGDGGGGQKFKNRIRVPTQNVESLNVVVAASIALAHKARQNKT